MEAGALPKVIAISGKVRTQPSLCVMLAYLFNRALALSRLMVNDWNIVTVFLSVFLGLVEALDSVNFTILSKLYNQKVKIELELSSMLVRTPRETNLIPT